MRTLVVLGTLAVAAPAVGAPVAVLRQDLNGDGTEDRIELLDDGTLVSGTARLKLAPAVTSGRITAARAGATLYVVVELVTPSSNEAVVLEGGQREVARVPIGGVGLDREYSIEVEATPSGVYRFQSNARVRRCDGKPALLFAEKLSGRVFTRVAPPSQVAETATVIAAKLDTSPATPPLLYQARAASHQAGAPDAGSLGLPAELDDGKPMSTWREDRPTDGGEGEFFTFQPRVDSARAHQLRIVPGDPHTAGTIRSFNRPRTIAIVAASGAWRVELPDAANDPLGAAYIVDLPQPIAGCVTVVLESTYGRPQGTTAIGELEVFAEGERTGGGAALLARVVAEGKPGTTAAAATLARQGALGAAAIDAELGHATDDGVRRRLVGALVKIKDPAATPALVRAATAGWVRDQDLLDVIGALAAAGQVAPLRELAGRAELPVAVRAAAASGLEPTGTGFDALVELSGKGPFAVRRAVIERLALGAPAALQQAAMAQVHAATAGDLWRALTRHARTHPAARPALVAAMSAALPTTLDYDRRYRMIDGIASYGDAAALRSLAQALRGLPPGPESAALRQVAVRSMASTPRPDTVEHVLALAGDPDPGVRLAALGALATVDAESPKPDEAIDRTIADALGGDGWPEVRRRAATALGQRCSRPAPAHALTDALAGDRDLDVRIDALGALVQCKAAGVRQLLAKTWDDKRAPVKLRQQAVALVGQLGDAQLAATLVARFTRWRGEALTDAAALVLAQSAAAAIGALHPPGAAPALLDALDDTAFPEIVASAALALGALGPACPAAARSKLLALARSDDQASVVAKRAAAQCGR